MKANPPRHIEQMEAAVANGTILTDKETRIMLSLFLYDTIVLMQETHLSSPKLKSSQNSCRTRLWTIDENVPKWNKTKPVAFTVLSSLMSFF